LLEYAADSDPLDKSSPTAPLLTTSGPSSFQYVRPAGRFVLWRCEGSTDLQTWRALLPRVEYQEEIVSPRALSDLVEVTAPPPAAAAQWFLRLRVSPVP
jgi:hypothetical protein